MRRAIPTTPIDVWALVKPGETRKNVIALCTSHGGELEQLFARPSQAAELAVHKQEVTRLTQETIKAMSRSVRRQLRKCAGCAKALEWKAILMKGESQ